MFPAAPPPPPQFLVAPPARIGRVRIGERQSAVLTTLGQGRVTRRDPIDPTTGMVYVERTYRRRGLVVAFSGRPHGRFHVQSVRTIDPRYRTSTGIGVGSSLADVQTLAGVDCYDSRCQIGHSPAALFEIRAGQVSMVAVVSGAD